jgi:hypothetical protein
MKSRSAHVLAAHVRHYCVGVREQRVAIPGVAERRTPLQRFEKRVLVAPRGADGNVVRIACRSRRNSRRGFGVRHLRRIDEVRTTSRDEMREIHMKLG